MNGERLYAAGSPIYPIRSPSLGLLRADELVRPGTVALRVQALNQRLRAQHFRPSPVLRTSRSQALRGLTGQLPHGGSAPELPLRLNSTAHSAGGSEHSPGYRFADLSTRSSFGTRKGGGWAPPAGRRTTLHESTAPGAEWASTLKAAERGVAICNDHPDAQPPSPRLHDRGGNDSVSGVPGYNIEGTDARSNFAPRPTAIPSEGYYAEYTPPMSSKQASAVRKNAPRPSMSSYPSSRVMQDVDPRYSMAMDAWDHLETVSNPDAMKPMRPRSQKPTSHQTDLVPELNPWNRTASYTRAPGRPNPAIAEVMQNERPARLHGALGKSGACSDKISDGPLVWSPETYDSAYPFTSDSEPFPPSTRHQVSLMSAASDWKAHARPFSFTSDFERLDTRENPQGPRRPRPDSRKKSASQVSLEALLRGRDSKEGVPNSRWSRAMTKTSSGLFSLLPRFFARSEHAAPDEIEEEQKERPPSSSRSDAVKAVGREPASPAPLHVAELETASVAGSRTSPRAVHGGRAPYRDVGMDEKIPVEPKMRPNVGDPGDQSPFSQATVDMRGLELTLEECMLAYKGLSTGSSKSAHVLRGDNASTDGGVNMSGPSTNRNSLDYMVSTPHHRRSTATTSRLSRHTSGGTRTVAHPRHGRLDSSGSKLKRVHVVINMDELADVNLTLVINGQGQPRCSSEGTQSPRGRS